MSSRGLLFHPDDDPADIIGNQSGLPLFTKAESKELRTILSKLFNAQGDAIYSIGLPVFRRAVFGRLGRRLR